MSQFPAKPRARPSIDQTPANVKNIPKGADPKDFVPEPYREFLDVFNPQAAKELPPHRRQDLGFELIPGKPLPNARPYPMKEEERRELQAEIDRLLSQGFIRPSRSSIASPVLFVKKPNGGLRLCVDYRVLNDATVKAKCGMPLTQETLTMLSSAKYYTKFDIIAAFNTLRIKAGQEYLTAFTTRYGLFEYLVVPFGLSNGPAAFQGYANEVMTGILDRFVTMYMDDVFIFSEDLETHRQHVKEVLTRLRKARLYVDIAKSEFEVQEAKYLGLIISTEGIKMDPAKVKAVADWAVPQHLKDVQAFLGFCNFYRRFIPRFSTLAAPLTALTRKGAKFDWTMRCQSAFDSLKASFTAGEVLRHFDPALPTILETDASDFVVAAVLSQRNPEGEVRPVAFMSRKMTPPECNYDIFDKELLAVVAAFEAWPAELGSVRQTVAVYSDHKNLEYFTTTKKLNRRQARWSELLAEYDFQIKHRPGAQNGKADALTRISSDRPSDPQDPRNLHQQQVLLKPRMFLRPVTTRSSEARRAAQLREPAPSPTSDSAPLAPETPAPRAAQLTEPAPSPTNDSAPLALWTPAQWEEACLADPFCQSVRTDLETPRAYRRDIELASARTTESSFALKGREYVPKDLQAIALRHFHEHPLHGHRGAAALYGLINRAYWWPLLHKDCSQYARGCRSCGRNNPATQPPHGHLQPLSPPSLPFRHLTLDFVGPLPASRHQARLFRYLLTVVDRLTKRSWFIPMENMTAEETMRALVDHVFRFSGLPDSLVSDQGRTFIDNVWKATCDHLGIRHQLSTAYHPQTDGQSERMNKTVEVYLRHYVNYRQDDWARLLPLAEFAANNHVNASTGLTPFFASFGCHPRLPAAAADPPAEFPPCPPLAQEMSNVHRQCQDAIALAQAFQESYANEKRLPAPRYEEGDLVYLNVRHLRRARPTAKLDHVRAGPYRIVQMKTPLVAKLDLPEDVLIDNNFHVSLLRPAPEGLPSQAEERPPPLDVDTNAYVVEAILNHRRHRGKLQYLVKWRGYDDTNWEDCAAVDDCSALDDYFIELGTRQVEGGG